MSAARQSPHLDQAVLTDPVRRAMRSDRAEIVDWHCQPITYANTEVISGGVYRIAGRARDRGVVTPWSLVLKVIRAEASDDDPAGPDAWAREVRAYRDGLLDSLPGGMIAPWCFGVVEYPGEGAWLWLEDIAHAVDSWPLAFYGRAARTLGRFNGAYLAGYPLPAHPCLSTHWLRAAAAVADGVIDDLSTHLAHPLVRRAYAPSTADRFLRLWHERERLLTALERLPQTFCHMDAWRRNLFLTETEGPDDRLVAIDWAFVGVGSVGEDLAPLVAATAFFEDMATALPDLDTVAVGAYVHGLRDAGWPGDEQMVRFGYGLAAALRFGLGWLPHIVTMALDTDRHAEAERLFAGSMARIMDRFGHLNAFLLERADEAREMVGELR